MSAVRIVSFLRRRPDISREEFYERWAAHGQMMLGAKELMGLVGYRQMRANNDDLTKMFNVGRGSGDTEPYDGVAEIWIESIEHLTAPPSAEKLKFLSELEADEKRFVDHSRSYHVVGDEVVLLEGPPA